MNAFSPDAMRAETITITGHGGDEIEAYRAMPLAEGSRGGIVWIHHMPGYDRRDQGVRPAARRQRLSRGGAEPVFTRGPGRLSR